VAFLESPLNVHWIDFVLVMVALEIVVLRIFLSKRWTGASVSALIANLAAGAALILAIRLALSNVPGGWILLCLSLSLLAHLTDLAYRWRQTGS